MNYDDLVETVLNEIKDRTEIGLESNRVSISQANQELIDNEMILTFARNGCSMEISDELESGCVGVYYMEFDDK